MLTMKIERAERNQIENEMLFRRMNEKVGDGLGALDADYIDKHEVYLIRDEESLIKFKCECSDENCKARIALKLSEYQDLHKDRDTFIVKTNHQVDPIEKVILSGSDYSVVRKNNSLPDPKVDKELNITSIDNASKK